MRKKLTLNDLALAAKVSPATVSRVVAGNPNVDPEIRDTVHRTAAKLGIDLEERRKRKSRIIAFLLANRDVLHNFQARVLLGAEQYCSKENWELLFLSFRYSPDIPPEALHLPQLLSDNTNARAAILGGINFPNLITALHSRNIPCAVLGNNVPIEWKPVNCDIVFSDDISGAHEATAYLIAKGHTRIGFVGNLQLPWYNRCAIGYQKAMVEANLHPLCSDIRSDGIQLGYLATKSLISMNQGLTAILAGSDPVAAGVYDALRESNIQIPNQMSVIGLNDTEAINLTPQLTSIREFPEELGRHLAEFVLSRIQNPKLPRKHITIPTQLIRRASVAAAPEFNFSEPTNRTQ